MTSISERIYPQMAGEEFTAHMERYKFAINYTADKTVYSLACGSGYGEFFLATIGKAKKVIGVDNNADAINFAKAQYKVANLEYLQADILCPPLPKNSADIIISFETIEHLTKDELFLNEIKNLLKPDGYLILSTPNRAFSYKNLFSFRPLNPYHVFEYKKNRLFKVLKKNFKNIEFFGQKKILKRSIITLPVYLYYKLSKKISIIETEDYIVRKYPKEKIFETCYFVVIAKQQIN